MLWEKMQGNQKLAAANSRGGPLDVSVKTR